MNVDAAHLCRFAENGDSAAIAEVIRRHIDAVYSAALRRVGGDAHLAEDVTQAFAVSMSMQDGGGAFAAPCRHPNR